MRHVSDARVTFRQRYYVIISAGYILAGLIIVGRSVVAHVYPIVLLGVVFVALGLVRLKDFYGGSNRT